MKIALCTTTIHVPHALKLMRKCSADVHFFIMGDRKTPDRAVVEMLAEVPSHSYYGYDFQGKLGYRCHAAIGENTLARRNIAFLEALKWGADVIYSHDDDNIPIGTDHFDLIEAACGYPFNGIKVTGTEGWFDPGTLLIPATRHRGYPHARHRFLRAEPCVDARVGVAAGLIIGDPDIDATTRMETRPNIGAVHVLGSTGIVVDPNTWTIWNSQNTAVVRELIPAWFMMPGVGRHDDIYASLIVQRVARERDLHVHFGPPFCYQQRNEHDLLVDLRAEIDGMGNVEKLAALLDGITLTGKNVISDVADIYETLEHCSFIPKAAITAAYAWLNDCAEVL